MPPKPDPKASASSASGNKASSTAPAAGKATGPSVAGKKAGTTSTEEPESVDGVVNQNATDNTKDAQATFTIYTFNKYSKTTKMEKFVTLGSVSNVAGLKMSELRDKLSEQKALDFHLRGCSFCNTEGAVVDEDLTFDLYKQFLDQSQTDGDEAKGGKGSNTVYLKSRERSNKPDADTKEAVKAFMSKELDLSLKKAELPSTTVEKIKSEYIHKSFAAEVHNNEKLIHPVDMKPEHWQKVIEVNSLLKGLFINAQSGVENAMHPAFYLKPRPIHDSDLELKERGIKATSEALLIPRFTVHDDSYVIVKEDSKKIISAIATSSLSETAAEVALGVSKFGMGGGVKAGFKSEDEQKEASAEELSKKQMMISYNFPRVIMELGFEDLEVTGECSRKLSEVQGYIQARDHEKAAVKLEEFKDTFGRFFATRMELGGKLTSHQDTQEHAGSKLEQRANSMKAAAALSFSSPAVQAAASASHGQSDSSKTENKDSSLQMNMNWTATGGDTLLCNNPPAWCGTVANFYNWRVINRERLYSIIDLLALIPGKHQPMEDIKAFDDETEEDDEEEQEPAVFYNCQVEVWLQNGLTMGYATLVENEQLNEVVPNETVEHLRKTLEVANSLSVLGPLGGMLLGKTMEELSKNPAINKAKGSTDGDMKTGVGAIQALDGTLGTMPPKKVELTQANLNYWKDATHFVKMDPSPPEDNSSRFMLKGKMQWYENAYHLRFGVPYELRTKNDDLPLSLSPPTDWVEERRVLAVRNETPGVAVVFSSPTSTSDPKIYDNQAVGMSLHPIGSDSFLGNVNELSHEVGGKYLGSSAQGLSSGLNLQYAEPAVKLDG